MRTRRGRFTGIAPLAATLAIVWSCAAQCAAQVDADPIVEGPLCACCPSPTPAPETMPGASLFWHDPCDDTRDPCELRFWWDGEHHGCPPCWYAMAELMTLFRHHDTAAFQSLPELNNNGAIVLSTADFDADFTAGTRVLAGRALGDWYRVEGLYYRFHDWSDTATVRNTDANAQGGVGNLFSPFSDFGDPAGQLGLDFNEVASIDFTSTLDNIEINLRRRVGHPQPGRRHTEASVLIGLRYTNVRETFGYFTQSNVPLVQGAENTVAVRADNEMFGVQIGWLSQFLFRDRGWVDFDVKGAVFTNKAAQRTTYTNVDNNGLTTTFNGAAAEDVASFLLDLSLTINYQFAPNWTVRGGYNALFLWGIATGPDNFNTDINTLALGPPAVDHGGTLIYHGPSLAVVWAW